jgi:peptidoglycan/LPS O-acetylase OafA/YrhL
MFFMLSGFVMTHVYHKAFTQSVAQNYQGFIVARLARIYPLHVFILLLFVATAATPHLLADPTLAVVKNVPLSGPQSLGAFVANLFMLQGLDAGVLSWNYPAWSISVEFFAYLLFPFALPLIWRSSAPSKIALALALFGLLAVLAYFTRDNFNQWDGPITLVRCLPEFLLGTLLYCAYRAGRQYRWPRHDWIAYVIVVALVVCLHDDAPDILIACLFTMLIIAAVLNRGKYSEWINASPLIWLGDISYSLYLIHGLVAFMALMILDEVGFKNRADLSVAASLMIISLMIGVCLLAAHLSYYRIETFCRRYVRNFFSPRPKHPSSTTLASSIASH